MRTVGQHRARPVGLLASGDLLAALESGAKVKAALMVLPDQAAKDLEMEWFAEGDNIRVADAFLVADSRPCPMSDRAFRFKDRNA